MVRYPDINTTVYSKGIDNFSEELSEDVHGIHLVSNLNQAAGAHFKFEGVNIVIKDGGVTLCSFNGIDELKQIATRLYDESTLTAKVNGRAFIPLNIKGGRNISFTVVLANAATDDSGTLKIHLAVGKPIVTETRILRVASNLATAEDKVNIPAEGYLEYIGIPADLVDTDDNEEIELQVNGVELYTGQTAGFMINAVPVNQLLIPVEEVITGTSRITAKTTIDAPYVLMCRYENPIGRTATPAEKTKMQKAGKKKKGTLSELAGGNGAGWGAM